MKQVIRNIDPASAQDLLEGARACLSFACDEGPQAQPIVLVWQDGRYLAGIPRDPDRLPGSGQEVVLLLDQGVHYFDLRALYIRGRMKQASAPRDAPAGHIWVEVVPCKTVAWDYGIFREVRDES